MNHRQTPLWTMLFLLLPLTLSAQTPRRDGVTYEPKLKDPILEQIRVRNEKADAERDKETAAIRASQKQRRKAEKEARKVLRATLPQKELPGAPETFHRMEHFPPQAQYYTGTCWAYAATSFLEAEIIRQTKRRIKMSEMHTVYYEYLEKARRFVRERGDSHFAEGSQHNAVTRIWGQYGAVPLEAYDGIVAEDGLHDHTHLSEEMNAFLRFVKTNDLWDEEWVLQVIRTILDRYMGPPPQRFTWEGREYTPKTFLAKACKVNPADYVGFMSTLAQPFYRQGEFKVPDNWWHDASYHNVPLDQFMAAIDGATRAGYSMAIGGDVSEPGKNFRQDLAFVPTFDIPPQFIDQASREYRIANGTTGDDHGIHLVGWKDVKGVRWYLIKDSGRSARHGQFDGYYFFREDFVKLKMLTFMVHKDAVKELLKEMKKPETDQAPSPDKKAK